VTNTLAYYGKGLITMVMKIKAQL